jgi:hypothetical protein
MLLTVQLTKGVVMMKLNRKFSVLLMSAILASASVQAWADRGVGGDETNVDVFVLNAWTVLTSEPFDIVNNITHCVATSSADALNPNMGDDNLYFFTLSIDNANPMLDGDCERTIEFDANGTNAQRVEEVSTTCTFRNIQPGLHEIFWLATGVGGAPVMTVADNSFTFVCANRLIDPIDGEGDGNED